MKPHSITYFIEEDNINYYGWAQILRGFGLAVMRKYLDRRVGPWASFITNDKGKSGVNLEDWHDLGRRTMERVADGRLNAHTVLREHFRRGEKIFQLCNIILKKDLTKLSNKQILKFFKSAWPESYHLNAIGMIPIGSDFEHNFLSTHLVQVLRDKGVPEHRLHSYQNILISMNIPTLYWREKLNLLKRAHENKNLKALIVSPEFKRHVQNYFWLNYGYQGPEWTLNDFVSRSKEIYKHGNVSKQYHEHKNYLVKLKTKQKKLEKKLRLSPKEKMFFEAARIFMFCKAYRMEVRHRFCYVSDQIFKELSRRFRVPISVFRYATDKEILQILKEGKVANKDRYLNRRRSMLEIMEDGRVKIYSGSKARKLSDRIEVVTDKVVGDSAAGQVAFQGYVIGKVKIVNSIKHNSKIKRGDILVSVSTTPDLLPAMERAAAFVTDVGGITSHAAIVAREMKKPCIIGTRVATKIFKDGDKVEVDGRTGVVRKLN